MEYSKSIDFEKALFERISTRRYDLSIIERLLEKMGNPQHAFPSVHIAGTNGKGSVSRKIAAAYTSAGYRVGLFISPHIVDFEERITINGVMIAKEKVLAYYAQIEDPEPNFFECATFICFQYFKEEKVDIAIIETGLGGKLDATNVITPLLSIITSISMDHSEYLGETLDKIAAQKAGIIKPNVPVVLGPRVKFDPIYDRAKELSAPITQVEVTSPFYEEENNAVARAALEILKVPERDIAVGLKARMPCRFERRGNAIFDVAHNPDGFARLAEALQATFPNQTFHFVIGMSRRKDIKACLQAIERLIQHVHFVESGRADGATVAELEQIFQTISNRPYSLEKSILLAMENAGDEIFVICGTFFIMAEALRQISDNQLISKSIF